MLRGLYTAVTGLLAHQRRQDVTANNIANADTAGFQREDVVFRSFPEVLLQRLEGNGAKPAPVGTTKLGVEVAQVYTDFQQGPMDETRRNTDLALAGYGFFTIETTEGIRYSRAGSFLVDRDGFLVTPGGHYLLGQHGRLQVGGEDFTVTASGEVRVDDRVVDHLRITGFAPGAAVARVGANQYVWQPQFAQPVNQPDIRQGMLEKSNVSFVAEMTNMLNGFRAYQASQRVLQAQDELLGKAVNEVGVVR